MFFSLALALLASLMPLRLSLLHLSLSLADTPPISLFLPQPPTRKQQEIDNNDDADDAVSDSESDDEGGDGAFFFF